MKTLPSGLATFMGTHVVEYGIIMAGACLSLLPILIAYFIAQKQFVQGIAMTGMKLVASAEMDYRNSSIVGLAAALGMGVSQATAALASFPTWVTTIFGKSPVVLATIIAVMLNVILPKTRDEQKEEAKKKIKIEQKLEEDHREFGE